MAAAVAAAWPQPARDGKPPTNAKWTRWATRINWDEASRWQHRPRLHRAAIRGGIAFAAASAVIGLHAAWPLTVGALELAVWLGAAWAGVWGWRRLQPHHRDIIRPTRDALLPAVGVIPWDLAVAEDRSRVEFTAPYGYVARDDQRQLITHTLNVKVPGPEPLYPDWSWLHGRRPRIVYTRRKPPPLKVTFGDIRCEVEAAKEHEVIPGLGSGGQPYKRSLATETPHIAICMPTGDGKSVFVMNLAAQCLFHGWLLVVLDYKMLSHAWAEDLPNVCYAWTPAMIHEALMWLACDDYQESELTYRKKLGKANHDIEGNVTVSTGPPIAVLFEERNATTRQLTKYWRGIGGKGQSPALAAADEIGETGRQFGISVWHIGQALSAKAMSGSGSRDAHENVGLWFFGGGTSRRTWDLCTDGHPFPPPTTHKGRYNVVYRQSVDAIQSPWEPGGKAQRGAREFAMSGTVAVPHRDLPFTRRVGSVPGHVIGGQGILEGPEQPGVLVHGTRPPHLRTIREAIAEGMFEGVDVEAVRQRVKRAKKKGALRGYGWDGSSELFDQGELRDLVR